MVEVPTAVVYRLMARMEREGECAYDSRTRLLVAETALRRTAVAGASEASWCRAAEARLRAFGHMLPVSRRGARAA